jgi:hypothetical protein
MLQKPDSKTQNILNMAEFFENLSVTKFNMKEWEDSRGRKCICGWINYLNGDQPDSRAKAQEFLGISYAKTLQLFSGNASPRTTPRMAARVLRHLAITGEVDWDA